MHNTETRFIFCVCIHSYTKKREDERKREEGVSNLYPGEMREDSDMSYRYQEGLRAVVVSKQKRRGSLEALGKYLPPPYAAHLQ